MENQAYAEWIENLTKSLFYYSAVVIVPIGLFFNLIEFLVFRSKDFEKANFGFLMNLSIVSNSFSLVWNFIVYEYLASIGISIESYSWATCSLFLFFSRIFQQMPLYSQALISFLNYLSVTHPAKFIILNKKSNYICMFLLILVVLSLLNVPSSMRSLAPIANSSNQNCTATDTLYISSIVIHTVLSCLVPIILINFTNYSTVRNLIRPRVALNFAINNEIRYGRVCALLGLIFFIFNFPLACIQITLIIYNYVYEYPADSYTLVTINFSFNCSRVFSWTYYAMGFFLNVSFNKIFRKILFRKFMFALKIFFQFE